MLEGAVGVWSENAQTGIANGVIGELADDCTVATDEIAIQERVAAQGVDVGQEVTDDVLESTTRIEPVVGAITRADVHPAGRDVRHEDELAGAVVQQLLDVDHETDVSACAHATATIDLTRSSRASNSARSSLTTIISPSTVCISSAFSGDSSRSAA